MMKKTLRVFSIILLLLLYTSISFANSEWSAHSSKDEMTDEITWYAFSPRVRPLKKMGFPYGDTTCRLAIGFDGKEEWVYFVFNNAPNITNSTTRDGYDSITTRIKWDDDLETIRLIQSWGAKSLHAVDIEETISKIATSNKVLLELNWYGENKVHFEIPLTGSYKIINSIRDELK